MACCWACCSPPAGAARLLRFILRKLMMGMVATAAFAACAVVSVVALAFALYALVEPTLGRAGAAAVVAGVAALIIALAAVIISIGANAGASPAKRPAAPAQGESLIERALLFMQEKPVIAVAAALGAGFLAIRNPTYVGSVIRSILGVPEPPPRR